MDRLELITWLDHMGNVGWRPKEILLSENPSTCHTAGWVAYEDDSCIKMYSTYSEEGNVADTTIILKSAVVERTLLRKRKVKSDGA